MSERNGKILHELGELHAKVEAQGIWLKNVNDAIGGLRNSIDGFKIGVLQHVSTHAEAIDWLKKRDWIAGIIGAIGATGTIVAVLWKITHQG